MSKRDFSRKTNVDCKSLQHPVADAPHSALSDSEPRLIRTSARPSSAFIGQTASTVNLVHEESRHLSHDLRGFAEREEGGGEEGGRKEVREWDTGSDDTCARTKRIKILGKRLFIYESQFRASLHINHTSLPPLHTHTFAAIFACTPKAGDVGHNSVFHGNNVDLTPRLNARLL